MDELRREIDHARRVLRNTKSGTEQGLYWMTRLIALLDAEQMIRAEHREERGTERFPMYGYQGAPA